MRAHRNAGGVAALTDRYRLLGRLGSRRGGRFRAHDALLRRTVVIEPTGPDPSTVVSHHPGLVALYDAVAADDGYLLVTQFVDGPPLDRATRRELSVPAALALGARLADALDHLHRHGAVHGRIRCSRVRLDRARAPHLLGVAHRSPEGADRFAREAADDVAAIARLVRTCLRTPRPAPHPAEVPAEAAAALAAASGPRPGRPTARGLAAALTAATAPPPDHPAPDHWRPTPQAERAPWARLLPEPWELRPPSPLTDRRARP
ncbi:hypothetical protein [Pseudonocardia xishanensis]|uniref:Protein kinase domain-containing protein n=1 Tax=Pseudonocardia xishanensis TaxID=630995 RepID=A0ABP8RU53_9PSEU